MDSPLQMTFPCINIFLFLALASPACLRFPALRVLSQRGSIPILISFHPGCEQDIATRLGIVVTLFLALVAVQFVITGGLPSSSYTIPTQNLVILSVRADTVNALAVLTARLPYAPRPLNTFHRTCFFPEGSVSVLAMLLALLKWDPGRAVSAF
jgi:hypothetical protein